jgi:thymidylate synthase
VERVEARTLGEAWLEACRRILAAGADAAYDGAPIRELAHLALAVADPDPDDTAIAELGDPEWLAWMRRSFDEPGDVAELGGARSYALRLRDYEGRDQVAWVVERLRADPDARSAAITMLQPLTDTTYVPCVSLLDFWRVDGALELVVYAHSLDFGKKAYGNLVELARLQHEVAGAVGAPVGALLVHAKSAHVYGADLDLVRALVERAQTGRAVTTTLSR